MYRRIQIHPERCTACGLCAQICGTAHTGSSGPAGSRIWVYKLQEGVRFVPLTCTQCDDAFCKKACPTGAISVDPSTGVKRIAAELCVGCRMCTLACPFGAASYDAYRGKAIKCDECDGDPLCVSVCATRALTYEVAVAREDLLRRRTAQKVLAALEG